MLKQTHGKQLFKKLYWSPGKRHSDYMLINLSKVNGVTFIEQSKSCEVCAIGLVPLCLRGACR